LEEGVPRRKENYSSSNRISAERGISREKMSGFCSGGILFTQSTTWVFCSAGNPPPRKNPGLKCTRTDNISEKFEFKMYFK
jgi:hypothetical protein